MNKINEVKSAPDAIFFEEGSGSNNFKLSDTLIKQARKSGKLNLSDKHLLIWPEEVLKLNIFQSNTEINFEKETSDDDYRWWELVPLKYLDMSCNNIKKIPAEIKALDSLMTLLLQQNNLVYLPPELGQLKNLIKLNLSHNKLNEFPLELCNMKELRSLNLSNNVCKIFPEFLYDLVMLEYLDISSNVLEEVGPGMGFLTRLIDLNLSYNNLVCIPREITSCKALRSLNLSNNKITSLGLPDLQDMHHLEVIQLQYNNLTTLPNITGCTELKEIHLGFNKIETLIPEDKDEEITIEELSTLSHLQVINLRNNGLKELPKELSCLMNLSRLDLSNNNLKELPNTLSLLPHLEILLVEGNSLRSIRRDIIHGGTRRLLNYLRQSLPVVEVEKHLNSQFPCVAQSEFPDRYSMRCGKAVNLSSKDLCDIPCTVFEEAVAVPCTIVDISKNKLLKVPCGVWLLYNTLNDLNISHNQLKEIPTEIETCLSLRYLNLSNNNLSSLPEGLSSCTRLRELNVSFNSFEEIPECTYNLLALEILSLSNNKISSIDAEKLLELKVLTHFDLTNNNLTNIPPLIGKMTQLRTFGLEGNALRVLRPATIAKGTEAVLAWLRNKIV